MADLSSSKAKLAWAKRHIELLKSATKTFADAKPYTVRFEADPRSPGSVIVYGRISAAISDDIPLIAGDCANNLRSALDHLVYTISALSDADKGSGLLFPIYTVATEYNGQKARHLRGVSAAHSAIVESFQPYQRGNVARAEVDPLAMLAQLNNVDKHRRIPVVTAVAVAKNTISEGDHSVCDFELINNGLITGDEAPIGRFIYRLIAGQTTEMNVDLNHSLEMKFDKGIGRVEGRNVGGTLVLICRKVEEILSNF